MMDKKKLEFAIRAIEDLITKKEILTNFVLLEISKEQGIEITGKHSEGHIVHEILEVAVNYHISKKHSGELMEKTAWI